MIPLYGKKLLKGYMERTASGMLETREAILWEVDRTTRICRIKIQGSDQKIVAYYPSTWEVAPYWLKPGNSVRVQHTEGVRGRIEVVGPGQTVPTPVVGSTFPPVGTGIDGLVKGCYVAQVFNRPKMAVHVHVGQFKIGGATYTLGPIKMANGDNFLMGDGGAMGDIAAVVPINAAPAAGLFRYDLISVASDLTVDYTAGTASATPDKPSVGSDHVALAYLLVSGGDVQVLQANVSGEWTAPVPMVLSMVIANDELHSDDPSTNVTLKILDQYGHEISTTDRRYFSLEIIYGKGKVWSEEDGESTTKVGGYGYSSKIFFYYRDDDSGVLGTTILQGTLLLERDITAVGLIKVYDELGNLIGS